MKILDSVATTTQNLDIEKEKGFCVKLRKFEGDNTFSDLCRARLRAPILGSKKNLSGIKKGN
jgi:hypothetical protein